MFDFPQLRQDLSIYNLGQNCPLYPQTNVVRKASGFWQQNLGRFNSYIGG